MTVLKIGQVAEQTGLSIHTLRYYEQIGLLLPITRESSGHRLYSERDVASIRFVIALRTAGMPVADIKRYMELVPLGADSVIERLQLLESHQATVEEKIAELQQHLHAISAKITHYREVYQTELEAQLTT